MCQSFLTKDYPVLRGYKSTLQIEEFTDAGQSTHIKLDHVERSRERQEEKQQEGKYGALQNLAWH